jgi:hypothetical protein
MGLSLGGSYGSSNQSATGSSTQANTYSPGQTTLQSQLGSNLSTSLSDANAGVMTPGVTAMKTAAADTINKTSGGLMDRVNSFLAARGFGKSGQTGQAALQGELGRESQLAGNEANFAQVQQGVNSQNLLASLNYALTSMGLTASGASTGSSSGWGVAGGVAGKA